MDPKRLDAIEVTYPHTSPAAQWLLMKEAVAEIRRLMARDEMVTAALNDTDFDISPCCDCGKPVLCLPDGLTMCEECA